MKSTTLRRICQRKGHLFNHGDACSRGCGFRRAPLNNVGRISPPYGGFSHCMAVDCGPARLSEEIGVYLHRNQTTGKLVILCGGCSRKAVELAPHQLPLVPL